MRLAAPIAVLSAIALCGPASADEAPKPAPPAPAKLSAVEVLKKVDEATNAFKDAVWESKLRVKEPSGQAREFAFTTYQKVPDKRLVKFASGISLLVEGRDTLYVYLPEFKKVRRLGTHVKNQTFQGSDFSYEDMSQISYSSTFDPKLVAEDGSSWTLELTQKPGLDLEFPRVKMVVAKEHEQPTRIEFMDAAGKKLKTQERSEFKKDSPRHWQPMRIVAVDHRRNDHTSEIIFSSSKIDSGLTDDFFSVRTLQR
jgi:outer membrane lipoprotein-sorting protein